jgi:arylsulfatase A-like enzyme
MDPHWPYDAPEGYGDPRRSCRECDDFRVMQYQETSTEVHNEVRRRYDAEVAFTDAEIGRLWDELSARGVLDHTWLIVTSDHGEEFWEHHGFLHGHSLYDELLRVPLVIVPPTADLLAPRGVRVREQVRLEDVAATVFDVAGVQPSVPLDGTSLLGEYFMRNPAAPIVGEKTARPQIAGFLQQGNAKGWAARANGMKLIAELGEIPLLFDLAADPAEAQPITFQKPSITTALMALPRR